MMNAIVADPSVTKFQVGAWAVRRKAADLFIREMVPALWDVSIEHDLDPAFIIAQSAKETAYGMFGRAVTPGHFNTAGIKIRDTRNPDGSQMADNDPNAHARFANWWQGALAQVQHNEGYLGLEVPERDVVDPRYVWVGPGTKHFGTVVTVEDYNGRWAYPGTTYGTDILRLMDEIRRV